MWRAYWYRASHCLRQCLWFCLIAFRHRRASPSRQNQWRTALADWPGEKIPSPAESQQQVVAPASTKVKPPVCSYYTRPVTNVMPAKQVSLVEVYHLIKGDAFASCNKYTPQHTGCKGCPEIQGTAFWLRDLLRHILKTKWCQLAKAFWVACGGLWPCARPHRFEGSTA